MRGLFFLLVMSIVQYSNAQHPFKHFTEATDVRYDSKQPVINYTFRIDANDLDVVKVEMKLRNISDTFRLAMFVHPEYDDRYYRFIEDLQVKTKNGVGEIQKLENNLWKARTSGGEATINYTIRIYKEPGQRSAWRPFLSKAGGLIGGPQSYLYVVGATLAPSYVHLQLPKGWAIATGLQSTSDPNTFYAPTANALVDAPILMGEMKQWNFTTDGVPHRIVYWPLASAASIDSTDLISSIKKLTEQSVSLFGRLPYREYSFLFQDSSWGALEHANSVTLGITASGLKPNMDNYLGEIAHEYVHTWNLVRIRPVEYGDVHYHKIPLSKGLWWSEGLTLFYSDLLRRRAGLTPHSRMDHLKQLIARYFSRSAHYQLSAEKISMAAYAPAGFLGNYSGSAHLQGEVFGNLLDMFIRNETDGKRTMDDVMRKMMDRFSAQKGFEGKDIERVVGEVSGKSASSFFEDHIRGGKTADVNHYLSMIGLKATISWVDAADTNNVQWLDSRVGAYSPDQRSFFIQVMEPEGIWAKAGLNTGDELISVNGNAIKSVRDFNMQIRQTKINDTVVLEIKRKEGLLKKHVVASGYKRPEVVLEEINNPTPKQQRLLSQWKAGL